MKKEITAPETTSKEHIPTAWIDVNTIQAEILPISKEKIRNMLRDNLDVYYSGKRMYCEREQLLAFLRNEI